MTLLCYNVCGSDFMKEIIYNYDFLNEADINNIVARAKIIIENDSEEILLAYSNKDYFLVGGHVDNGESFDECIVREVKEETGIEIPYKERKPFFSIKYYNKDYPTVGKNTASIINYYSIKYNLIPDYDKIELTEEEKEGNFRLEYINKKDVIDVLTNSLKDCTHKNIVIDTM